MPQPGRMAGLGFVAQWNGYAKKPPLYGKPIVTESFLMRAAVLVCPQSSPATKGWELTHVMLPPFGAHPEQLCRTIDWRILRSMRMHATMAIFFCLSPTTRRGRQRFEELVAFWTWLNGFAWIGEDACVDAIVCRTRPAESSPRAWRYMGRSACPWRRIRHRASSCASSRAATRSSGRWRSSMKSIAANACAACRFRAHARKMLRRRRAVRAETRGSALFRYAVSAPARGPRRALAKPNVVGERLDSANKRYCQTRCRSGSRAEDEQR